MIPEIGHQQLAVMAVIVDEPQAARMVFPLLDHRFRQRAEKAFHVGLAHEQIQRDVHDLGLDLHHAFRTAPLGGLADERAAKDLGIVRVDFPRRLMFLVVGLTAALAAAGLGRAV